MSDRERARDAPAIGFVGIGRVGLPLATLLLAAGQPVVCCRRGHSEQLVSRGATIAGDGSPRAVAEAPTSCSRASPATGL